jgi:hypothetical protein
VQRQTAAFHANRRFSSKAAAGVGHALGRESKRRLASARKACPAGDVTVSFQADLKGLGSFVGSNPTPSAEAPWCYGSISFGSPNLGISPGSRKVVWSAISCPSSVSTLMLRGSKVSRSSFQR